MKCEHERIDVDGKTCCEGEVQVRGAMTAYHFEGVLNSPEDPNRDLTLCEACWEEYYDYWQERWDEYYSGQL